MILIDRKVRLLREPYDYLIKRILESTTPRIEISLETGQVTITRPTEVEESIAAIEARREKAVRAYLHDQGVCDEAPRG